MNHHCFSLRNYYPSENTMHFQCVKCGFIAIGDEEYFKGIGIDGAIDKRDFNKELYSCSLSDGEYNYWKLLL